MSKKILLILFSMIYLFPANGYCLDKKYHSLVKNLKRSFYNNDRAEISKFINYPLKREYPVPSIDTPDDFLNRFDEVFDYEIVSLINDSTIDDWSEVGLRGIMLHQGELWIDTDGKVIAVNHHTEIEKTKKKRIIESNDYKLHDSLKKYIKPILIWKTKSYIIRVDEISEYVYRYAVWPAHKKQAEKPDLLLTNGIEEGRGASGNKRYVFINGDYTYACNVNQVAHPDTPPLTLEVYKNGELILEEEASEFKF